VVATFQLPGSIRKIVYRLVAGSSCRESDVLDMITMSDPADLGEKACAVPILTSLHAEAIDPSGFRPNGAIAPLLHAGPV